MELLFRKGRRFFHERRRCRNVGYFVILSAIDAGQLCDDGPTTAGWPATTATKDQTFTDIFQAPSTAHAQVLLCHQSQSGCQGLEAALTKDHPLQTRSPGNETHPFFTIELLSNHIVVTNI